MDRTDTEGPYRRNLLIAALAWALAGCSAGEVVLYEAEGSGLARGLTVNVKLDSAATEIGEALGWTSGVPDAEVRVHRLGTEFHWETARTDSAGIARFPHLLQGMYRVATYRVLTEEEATQLSARRRAFGDGGYIGLTDKAILNLRPAADVAGSVVFSEIYASLPNVDDVDYAFHTFIELYNNSDATVFLDGMIVGIVFPPTFGDGAWTCAQTERFRNDPGGVWAIWFHRFPGSGADYPLLPGETALIAKDAIDHSLVDPRFPDLSNADFEFLGPGDVDNPAVPNMPEVGLTSSFFGHGLRFHYGMVLFIARPVDLDGLVHGFMQGNNSEAEMVRFPAEAVVDVVATEIVFTYWEQNLEKCGADTHRSFDRLAGGFVGGDDNLWYSAQRVVIATANGRKILQDTNTSAVDLVRALRTPGTLPDQADF